MIAAITLFLTQLFCRHDLKFDGFDSGCSALIVRHKCLRCGHLIRSGQPVNRRLLP